MTTDMCMLVTVGVVGMPMNVCFGGGKVMSMTRTPIAAGPTSAPCTTEMHFYLLSGPPLPLPGAELSSPDPSAQLPGLLPGNCSHFGESCQGRECGQGELPAPGAAPAAPTYAQRTHIPTAR